MVYAETHPNFIGKYENSGTFLTERINTIRHLLSTAEKPICDPVLLTQSYQLALSTSGQCKKAGIVHH